MYNTKKINEDFTYIGASDRRLALFENVFPIERGVSYNSYLLKDEKTVLLDTVDNSVLERFLENLKFELGERQLDYIVVNHMESDHAGTLQAIIQRYPDAKIVSNAKASVMMKQYFDFNVDEKLYLVKEGDILETGNHQLTFVMAPMVHWPEVMVTYDLTDKILFSADAFGTFGALNGNIFADEVNFEGEWLNDARRYYTNIVGKYGVQVQSLLKKASGLEINMICPLHGPIWRENLGWFIDKYQKWSTYEPEEQAVLLLYGSIYGHTENTVEIIASKLADKGIKNIKIYDVSKTHFSEIVAEAFRCSHLVVASATYNCGIFSNMETVLSELKSHGLKNRKIAIVENGSWAPMAGGLISKFFEEMKDMEIIKPMITVKSSLKPEQLETVDNLVDNILSTIAIKQDIANPMLNIGYGLYLLTSKDEKDNGCIINTVNQITDNPKLITIAVNKLNYTCQMIEKTKEFNLSVLTEETPFSVFKQFGFTSGKNTDKFADCDFSNRCENGILALNKYTNTVISAKVVEIKDFDTHKLFIAEVTDDKIISNVPSVTYKYYFENIKPAVKPVQKKVGWVCKICGYVYEGKDIPSDFVCPICKHGVDDFEEL